MSEKNSVQRNLPMVSDLYLKATDLFPGYDRQEALTLYTMKKIDDSEKLITAQRRENAKLGELVNTLDDELKAVEQNEAKVQQELDRIRELARPEERERVLQAIAQIRQDHEDEQKHIEEFDRYKNQIKQLNLNLNDKTEQLVSQEKEVKNLSAILKGINIKAEQLSQDLSKLDKKKADYDYLLKLHKSLAERCSHLFDAVIDIWDILNQNNLDFQDWRRAPQKSTDLVVKESIIDNYPYLSGYDGPVIKGIVDELINFDIDFEKRLGKFTDAKKDFELYLATIDDVWENIKTKQIYNANLGRLKKQYSLIWNTYSRLQDYINSNPIDAKYSNENLKIIADKIKELRDNIAMLETDLLSKRDNL